MDEPSNMGVLESYISLCKVLYHQKYDREKYLLVYVKIIRNVLVNQLLVHLMLCIVYCHLNVLN